MYQRFYYFVFLNLGELMPCDSDVRHVQTWKQACFFFLFFFPFHQLCESKPGKTSGVETSGDSEYQPLVSKYIPQRFHSGFFFPLVYHLSPLSSPNLLHHLSFPSTLSSIGPVIIHHSFHFLFFFPPLFVFLPTITHLLHLFHLLLPLSGVV